MMPVSTINTCDRKFAMRFLKALQKGRPIQLLGVRFHVRTVHWVEYPSFLAEIEMVEVQPLIVAKS